MEAILREATEPYRALYALLAGCGPMCAGEALGLDITSIHPTSAPWILCRRRSAGSCKTS